MLFDENYKKEIESKLNYFEKLKYKCTLIGYLSNVTFRDFHLIFIDNKHFAFATNASIKFDNFLDDAIILEIFNDIRCGNYINYINVNNEVSENPDILIKIIDSSILDIDKNVNHIKNYSIFSNDNFSSIEENLMFKQYLELIKEIWILFKDNYEKYILDRCLVSLIQLNQFKN
jgi:hypothetical protein